MEFLRRLFGSGDFMPHGYCYLWNPGLMWLHVASDLLIALAYFTIPVTLIHFVRKRRDLPFHWMFVWFGVFIVACGATHAMEVWNLWHAAYWLAGGIEAITAAASVLTAALLVRQIPKALALPSREELIIANHALESEIQERETVEEELHRSEAHLRLVVEQVTDFAIFQLDPEGRVTSWNDGAKRIKGYSSEEILGQHFSCFYTPEDIQQDKPAQELRAAAAEGRAEDDGWRVRKDGSRFWASTVITALHDEDGTLRGFVKITRDNTSRKLTEEALQAAKEVAERSSRFKDQFLSTMSHELRTPLNAVLGFSELLHDERGGPLTAKQHRYIAHIETGGQHLLRLINDVLDLSKIESGRMQLMIESVRVDHVLSEIATALQPLADRKVQVIALEAPADLNVRADSTRLKQVLMNLVGNAIKFTPENGRIEMAAQRDKDKIRIEVRDNGPGIPRDEQERIFEAFYRLRQGQPAEGTGLGLAISQRFVVLMGGQLSIDSVPGGGSKFSFSLPKAPVVKAMKAEVEAAKMLGAKTPRILVVEDDPSSAQLIESQLAASGYETIFCSSPQQAADVAAITRPHAITLDILMRPVNGWQVLARLKSDPRTSTIPVIVLSVVNEPGAAVVLGADDYLMKPVERDVLLATLQRRMALGMKPHRSQPILVVEDDPPTREFIVDLLAGEKIPVATAADGAEARTWVAKTLPTLVILDLVLPKISGFDLLAEWRAHPRTADLPALVLTSKDLSKTEESYLREHAGALLQKQTRWQEALLARVSRVMPHPAERAT